MIDQTMRRHLSDAVDTLLAARDKGMIPKKLLNEPDTPLGSLNGLAGEMTISGNPLTAEEVTVRVPSRGIQFRLSRRCPVRPRAGELDFVECAVLLALSTCGWRLPFSLIEMKGNRSVFAFKGGIAWRSSERSSVAPSTIPACLLRV